MFPAFHFISIPIISTTLKVTGRSYNIPLNPVLIDRRESESRVRGSRKATVTFWHLFFRENVTTSAGRDICDTTIRVYVDLWKFDKRYESRKLIWYIICEIRVSCAIIKWSSRCQGWIKSRGGRDTSFMIMDILHCSLRGVRGAKMALKEISRSAENALRLTSVAETPCGISRHKHLRRLCDGNKFFTAFYKIRIFQHRYRYVELRIMADISVFHGRFKFH